MSQYDDTVFCYICGTKFPDCEETDLFDKSKNIENARYEVDCPACNSVLVINEETLSSGSMICPNCSAKAEFDLKNNEKINSVRGDESESLLFDGLYQYKYQNYSSYLRFFAGGLVVEVGSTGTPEQVCKWLNQNYENHGTYTISNGIISFDVISTSGRVNYSGRILKSSLLQLDIHSFINGYTAQNLEYHFCKCL